MMQKIDRTSHPLQYRLMATAIAALEASKTKKLHQLQYRLMATAIAALEASKTKKLHQLQYRLMATAIAALEASKTKKLHQLQYRLMATAIAALEASATGNDTVPMDLGPAAEEKKSTVLLHFITHFPRSMSSAHFSSSVFRGSSISLVTFSSLQQSSGKHERMSWYSLHNWAPSEI
jgi:gluconate kinase